MNEIDYGGVGNKEHEALRMPPSAETAEQQEPHGELFAKVLALIKRILGQTEHRDDGTPGAL